MRNNQHEQIHFETVLFRFVVQLLLVISKLAISLPFRLIVPIENEAPGICFSRALIRLLACPKLTGISKDTVTLLLTTMLP